MAKYRIKIEALDPAEELRAEYRIGIECEGFLIIANREDSFKTCVRGMNRMDIAECMANDRMLMGSAYIARGILDAMETERKITVYHAGKLGED